MTASADMALAELATPALLLDSAVLERNCAAMAQRAAHHGVALRPHLKTSKSVDVARLATRGQAGGITVSTVAEADYFAAKGFVDLTYAVGISTSKIEALDRPAHARCVHHAAGRSRRGGAVGGRGGARIGSHLPDADRDRPRPRRPGAGRCRTVERRTRGAAERGLHVGERA